jgi:hypothetical protein
MQTQSRLTAKPEVIQRVLQIVLSAGSSTIQQYGKMNQTLNLGAAESFAGETWY